MSRSNSNMKTRDMTLATYLISKGIDFRMVSDGKNKKGEVMGAWLFDSSDLVSTCVKTYEAGEARVEPRQFHSALSSARRSLFAFLDNAE